MELYDLTAFANKCKGPSGVRAVVPFQKSVRITLTDPVSSSAFWYMCDARNTIAGRIMTFLSLEFLDPVVACKSWRMAWHRRIARCFYPRNLVLKT